MSLQERYFSLQEEYEKEYGKQMLVMIEVGTFYETYQFENNGCAETIAKTCNVALTRRSKARPLARDNPYMSGFPKVSEAKYMPLLIAAGYKVVLVTQDKDDVSNRNVSRIFTASTYTENPNTPLSNYICVLFIERCANSYTTGISFAELSTGEFLVQQSHYISLNDCCEDLYRHISGRNPQETLLYYSNLEPETIKYLCKYVKSETVAEVPKSKLKLQHINETIAKVYSNNQLSPVENLNIEFLPACYTCVALLLDYIHISYSFLLSKLCKPEVVEDTNKLILHNSAASQLNIAGSVKYPGLFEIVNYTQTCMGKRLLKTQIFHPSANCTDIKKILGEVEAINETESEYYVSHLKNIGDLERLNQKLLTGTITKQELYIIFNSYTESDVLIQKPEIQDFLVDFKKTFNIPNLLVTHENVFNVGVYEDIDRINKDIEKCKKTIDKFISKLSNMIDFKDIVKFEGNTKTGFSLHTTNTRAEAIKTKLDLDANSKLKQESFSFKKDKLKTYISCKTIENTIHLYIKNLDLIEPVFEKRYYQKVEEYAQIYSDAFLKQSKEIAYLDTLNSRSICARSHGYNIPIVVENETSFVETCDLRHAIIEQLDQDTLYVPNDVNLNNNSTGILLYGVNGSGKSCYSKAVGLAVVLAQSGHYVPAKSMTISPFTKLYTRITSDDNMYKGLSSFYVEMQELKSIINYADEKSIVLGDEVCRGTEDVSGVSIVAACIDTLLEKKTKFIFATHLHKLPKLKILKKHKNLAINHIAVEITDNETISFSRKLCKGQGDKCYGLEIAKSILCNNTFFTKALSVRTEITGKSSTLVSDKSSKYNSNVSMTECEICKSTESLDCHHIIPQQSNTLKGKQKHVKGNLVTLCKECHVKAHHGNLTIIGWKKTSKGTVLDFIFQDT